MMTARLHGNAIPETEFRERILSAAAVLVSEGRPITLATLKSAGARGHERRITRTVQDLVAEGLIPVSAWNEGRDRRLAVADDEAELAARERSAEWVAEHDARWRRIRRIGEPRHARAKMPPATSRGR
jgi:hypothetical protein